MKTRLNLRELERFAQNRKLQPSDPLDVVKTSAAMMTGSKEVEQKGEVYSSKKVQNPDTGSGVLGETPTPRKPSVGLASHLVGNGLKSI